MVQTRHITSDDLRQLDIFSEVPEAVLEQLLHRGTVRQLACNRRISRELETVTENYYFLLRGAMALSLQTGQSRDTIGYRKRPGLGRDHEVLGLLEAGAYFSDAYLNGHGSEAYRLSCIATSDVSLLQFRRDSLQEWLDAEPLFRQRLAVGMAMQRDTFLARQEPASRLVQELFVRENCMASPMLRLSRIDQCLNCDKCREACRARHGVARMLRNSARLGRLALPTACRNCPDHPCVTACASGALDFDGATGDVLISDRCNGCGACAKQCPSGAILMQSRSVNPVDAGNSTHPSRSSRSGAPSLSLRQGMAPKAVKCDNCAGYSDRACIAACPTGALIEVQTDKVFFQDETSTANDTRRFSDAPFVLGLPGKARWKVWAAVCTLVILTALGVECFLIRAYPDSSMLSFYVQATGARIPVAFTSGKGVGHWFGYIGASMMLASAAYSLRTRTRVLNRAGSQSSWLSAHVWFGFTGATLVTYHSMFKLDRWASIGCVLMWLVVLTGTLGRYLAGRIRSAEGLAQFELDILSERCQGIAAQFPRSFAIHSLNGDRSPRILNQLSLISALLAAVGDRVLLVWLRWIELRSLHSIQERRAIVDCYTRWATHRRRRAYYRGVAVILRHWNIVHIVLVIVMAVVAGTHIVYGFRYKSV